MECDRPVLDFHPMSLVLYNVITRLFYTASALHILPVWEYKWAKREGKKKGIERIAQWVAAPAVFSHGETTRAITESNPQHFYFFIFPPKKFPFDLLVFTPFEPFDKLLRGPQLRIIGNLIDGPLNSFVRLIFEMSQHRRLWHQHIFFKNCGLSFEYDGPSSRSLVLIIWCCCCRMVPFQRASCRMHTVSHDDGFSLK
jgi:hypothetical protein